MFPARKVHFLASIVAKYGHLTKLGSVRLKREIFDGRMLSQLGSVN